MPPDTTVIKPDPNSPFVVEQLSPDLAAVSSFFGLEGMGAGLISTSFTRKEMTERLVNITRNAEDDSTSLRAMALLHNMGKDLMAMNGHLTNVKGTRTDEHGNTQTAEVTVRTLPPRPITTNPIADADGITVRVPEDRRGGGEGDQAAGGNPADVPCVE